MPNPLAHLECIERTSEKMNQRQSLIRLDRNEWVDLPSSSKFQSLLAQLEPEDFFTYPDPSSIYEAVAETVKLPENHIYITNGSDAAIRSVFAAFVEQNDIVSQLSPTYAMYSVYAQLYRAKLQEVHFQEGPNLIYERLVQAIENQPKVLFLANPNQPTGSVLSHKESDELVRLTAQKNILLVVDEAYHQFHSESFVKFVERDARHVIVTRSFSKGYGISGLRLGFAIAHPQVINQLSKTRGLHEVNAVAIKIGRAVLNDKEHLAQYLTQINEGRKALESSIEASDIRMPKCCANFQLLKFSGNLQPLDITKKLRQKGYLVRGNLGHPSVSDCIRVTLASPETMLSFGKNLLKTLNLP